MVRHFCCSSYLTDGPGVWFFVWDAYVPPLPKNSKELKIRIINGVNAATPTEMIAATFRRNLNTICRCMSSSRCGPYWTFLGNKINQNLIILRIYFTLFHPYILIFKTPFIDIFYLSQYLFIHNIFSTYCLYNNLHVKINFYRFYLYIIYKR